jgi:pimeloyl-ACP methyl ester carboxylesterase
MNFVLIPGAWMGAWVWEPVGGGLRALGHDVYPLTLSGLDDGDAGVSDVGLRTHVDDVLSVLEEGDLRDVVVVGHSYSGIVAGQVADRAHDRVAHTVYVDAFLPCDGKSMLDAFGERQREQELAQIAGNGGRWPAPGLDGVLGEPDLSEEQARWLAGRLVGHPGRTVSEPAVLGRPLAEQRATYVACAFEDSDDVAALRGEPGWAFRELEAGHWPMVSVPDELVALLDDVASGRGRP